MDGVEISTYLLVSVSGQSGLWALHSESNTSFLPGQVEGEI